MKQLLFSGLCTALVTPFYAGEVNYPMVDILIRRQIEAGVEAIVLAGTTGESPTLSEEEKLKLFRRGVAAADGKCKIIAGTGSNCTDHAIELSRKAQKCGVDGLLVVTPYYNKATPSGLVKHYKAIADSVDLPIIAYNVPSRTGVDISPAVCEKLALIPNIVGIKEACGDISKVVHIIADCGGELAVYSGNDDQTVATMALGGKGLISVVSNVLPLETNAMVTAAASGDYNLAALMQRRLLPLMDLMFCQVNPIAVKAAMKYMGYDVGKCRMPLDDLTVQNENKLAAFFRQWRQTP